MKPANPLLKTRYASLCLGIIVTLSATCMPVQAQVAEPISLEGFEIPSFAPNGFKYFPTGSPWTFSGHTGSGIQHDNSGWTVINAQEGRQTAFLQGADAHISTIVHLPEGTYTLSFYAAQRPYGSDAPNSIQIKINNINLGKPIKLSGTAFAKYTTSNFSLATAGYCKVEFVQIQWAGDSLLDAVSLQRTGNKPQTQLSDYLKAISQR